MSHIPNPFRRTCYPDSQQSIVGGNLITTDCKKKPSWRDGELCWSASGPALNEYNQLFPKAWKTLNNKCKANPETSGLSVKVFMIGLEPTAARPNLVFVCKNKYVAEEAQEIIEKSGILKGYPGFKTALMDILPTGDLIAVAEKTQTHIAVAESDDTGFEARVYDDEATEVYFNPADPITSIAIPIFVKRADTSMRRATANVVFDGQNYGLLTAAHAFHTETIVSDEMVGWGSESEPDDYSDSETEEEREQLSQHSRSSQGETSSNPSLSAHTRESSEQPDMPTNITREISTPESMPPKNDTITVAERQVLRTCVDEQQDVDIKELQYLGHLTHSSVNKDWALIQISNPSVIEAINNPGVGEKRHLHGVSSGPRSANVIIYTSWGGMSGTISEVPSLMKFAGSSEFAKVFEFSHDENLRKGDCGSLVVDHDTQEVYGHVIAGSAGSCTGFMVAAVDVLEELKKAGEWNLMDSPRNKTSVSDTTRFYLAPSTAEPVSQKIPALPGKEPDILERMAKMLRGPLDPPPKLVQVFATPTLEDHEKFSDKLAGLRLLAHSGSRSFEASVNEIPFAEVEFLEPIDDRQRTSARFQNSPVWIEWKHSEQTFPDEFDAQSEERIRRLAAMLEENNKVAQIRTAQYLGYFKDEDETRFGLVFANPVAVASSEKPVSLRALLSAQSPPLTTRISLMRLISEIMEPLHLVGWLHKGFCSANVLVFPSTAQPYAQLASADSSWVYTDPYISGFNDSRPEIMDGMTERPIDDFRLELYRHPAVQSSGNRGVFKMSYDIYSLGLVLLEIALWKPIEEVLDISLDAARPKDTFAVRQRILEEGMYLSLVKAFVGTTVEGVIRYCIEGPKISGTDRDGARKSDEPTGDQVALQEDFHTKVVRKLQGIHVSGL